MLKLRSPFDCRATRFCGAYNGVTMGLSIVLKHEIGERKRIEGVDPRYLNTPGACITPHVASQPYISDHGVNRLVNKHSGARSTANLIVNPIVNPVYQTIERI